MKERTKGFVAGILTTALIVSLGTAAYAAYQKTVALDYTGIKITMDGNVVTPKDANGNMVEPFAIDGTTYLPVRAIAGATGLIVGWNQSTQTVQLTSWSKNTLKPYDGYISAPHEIFTTSADDNGLESVYMYVDGTIEEFKNVDNHDTYVIKTSQGSIALSNIYQSNDWSKLSVGSSGRFCFKYLGMSEALKMSSGAFLETGLN
ncbi:MAG: copper amine oxidase N-terminal domain-containing protein [Intestinimonas sp.]|nr:copper amine oxidase N-terminal domain-containing protein [Intestinimonas sp.]